MRQVPLGHWHYFTWHLPALGMCLVAIVIAVAIGRSIHRDTLGPRAIAHRWSIVGWCSLIASVCSALVWPYLAAASDVRVGADGDWLLKNYLGIPVAHVPAEEVRSLRAVDLGGLGFGMGYLEIVREDGTVLRSVRISRDTLESARRALGYKDTMIHDRRADRVVQAHRYGASGPVLLVLAER